MVAIMDWQRELPVFVILGGDSVQGEVHWSSRGACHQPHEGGEDKDVGVLRRCKLVMI